MNYWKRRCIAAWDAIRYGYIHSGERVNPHIPDENFVNHLKVYRFAAQFCHDKTVLDVGCGTGYGSAYLCRYSQKVIGIDCSRQALRFARVNYRNHNLDFRRMNAENLEFPTGHFDFILSTENFEHLHDQNRAAREMSRVLKEDGMCLLATPNPEAFIGAPPNPFHSHECTYEELMNLFTALFMDVVILENQLSQRTDRGVVAKGSLSIFGKPVNVEHLSNTHSFFCFLHKPNARISEES